MNNMYHLICWIPITYTYRNLHRIHILLNNNIFHFYKTNRKTYFNALVSAIYLNHILWIHVQDPRPEPAFVYMQMCLLPVWVTMDLWSKWVQTIRPQLDQVIQAFQIIIIKKIYSILQMHSL